MNESTDIKGVLLNSGKVFLTIIIMANCGMAILEARRGYVKQDIFT